MKAAIFCIPERPGSPDTSLPPPLGLLSHGLVWYLWVLEGCPARWHGGCLVSENFCARLLDKKGPETLGTRGKESRLQQWPVFPDS